MTYTLNLNEDEMELLDCALTVMKTKWLKESAKALDGKSDISFEGCIRRIGQIDAMDIKLDALRSNQRLYRTAYYLGRLYKGTALRSKL